MTTVVKLDGLIKKYDNQAVVDGLSLEIREGEIFGLLGPNGAGKSTTMNMVCSLLKPTAGTIEVFGYNNRTTSRLGRMWSSSLPCTASGDRL